MLSYSHAKKKKLFLDAYEAQASATFIDNSKNLQTDAVYQASCKLFFASIKCFHPHAESMQTVIFKFTSLHYHPLKA